MKHEKEMEAFMADYGETYREEEERVKAHEARVVELLEGISRSIEHAQNLPSQQDHQSLKSDLAFKTREMKNSKSTAAALEVRRGGGGAWADCGPDSGKLVMACPHPDCNLFFPRPSVRRALMS